MVEELASKLLWVQLDVWCGVLYSLFCIMQAFLIPKHNLRKIPSVVQQVSKQVLALPASLLGKLSLTIPLLPFTGFKIALVLVLTPYLALVVTHSNVLTAPKLEQLFLVWRLPML